MKKISGWIDRVSDTIGKAMGWVLVLLTLDVALNALGRWIFNFGDPKIDESQWWLFSIIFLLAAGYALLYNDHVRVDIIYSLLPKKHQAWIDLLCTLLFLFPWSLLVILTSRRFIIASWEMREASADPGGLPAYYVLKAMIPIGFALMMLQGVSEIYKKIQIIRQAKES